MGLLDIFKKKKNKEEKIEVVENNIDIPETIENTTNLDEFTMFVKELGIDINVLKNAVIKRELKQFIGYDYTKDAMKNYEVTCAPTQFKVESSDKRLFICFEPDEFFIANTTKEKTVNLYSSKNVPTFDKYYLNTITKIFDNKTSIEKVRTYKRIEVENGKESVVSEQLCVRRDFSIVELHSKNLESGNYGYQTSRDISFSSRDIATLDALDDPQNLYDLSLAQENDTIKNNSILESGYPSKEKFSQMIKDRREKRVIEKIESSSNIDGCYAYSGIIKQEQYTGETK